MLVAPLVVGLVYFDVWRYGLVWDDFALLRHVADGSRIADPLPFSDNYIRPLAVWTVLAIEGLFGSVAAQHVFNLCLHSANTLGVTVLSTSVATSHSARVGVAAGLMYGLHPALIEPTAWISGRFDLLVATSLIAMLLIDLLARGRGWARALGTAGCVAMGLASKETAVALPVVLALWWRATERDAHDDTTRVAHKERVLVACSVAAVMVTWAAFRFATIGAFAIPEPHVAGGALPDRLLAASHASAEYLRLALAPWGASRPLHHDTTALDGGFTSWVRMICVLSLVAALCYLAIRFRNAAALALGAVALLTPVLHLHPLNLAGGALIAERFLAAPLVLLCIAFAQSSARFANARLTALVVVCVCVANIVTVRTLAPRWGDPESLWTWAEATAPASELPPINLAKTHYEAGEFSDALRAAERALAIDPLHPYAANNACAAALELGRPDDAIAFCAIGLDSGRASPSHWVNMMRAQLAAGDPTGAIGTHATARDRWGLRTQRMETLRDVAIDQLGGE